MKDFDYITSVEYLWNENLSLGAKGLLRVLFASYNCQVIDIYEENRNDSKEQIDKYFKELIDNKYLRYSEKNEAYIPYIMPYDQLD